MMKKGFLFLALTVFVVSFVAARFPIESAVDQMRKRFCAEVPFTPVSHALKNHPFVIVIVAFNNGASVEKTLASVFSQNYDHFRLIYIDDASDDGSFEVARDVMSAKNPVQITLIHNERRLGEMANVFRAVQECSDEEIVVLLSGEDWLAHEWVLQRLNHYYADPNLWFALAQAVDFPAFHFSQNPDLPSQSTISSSDPYLKTFHATPFKQLKESDYMTPMFELGKEHLYFIPEVLRVNNCRRDLLCGT